jgi:predicted alternative tryptophan synthase beta-subunit
MTARDERLAALSARAASEREDLAGAVFEVRRAFEEKRARWTSIGFWTGVLVSGATSAYRLFGRNSFSTRVDRWSKMGSLGVAVGRFLFRLFR